MRILDSLKRIENGPVVVVPSSSSSKWIVTVLCLTSLLLVLEQFQVCSSFSTVGHYYVRRYNYIHTMSEIKRQPRDTIVCHSHTQDRKMNQPISSSSFWKNHWSRQEVFQQCTSILTKSSLLYTSSSLLLLSNAPTAVAAATTVKKEGSSNSQLLMDYMKERVLSPDVSKMANIGGLQVSDIFYPSWFKGLWDVSSKTVDITAPCGPTLFGGMYQTTVDKEVGQSIQYKARFVSSSSNDDIIADREYNVQSIVSATMMSSSSSNDGSPIMDIRLATPHLFTCYLGGNAFRVDMLESQRAQSNNNNSMDNEATKEFICSEIVQQIVTSTQQQQQRIKLVETTTIYQLQNDGSILGKQKTFTYLVPSQDDMIALQQWQQAKNRAIDVRTYEVTYKKST